MVHTARGIVALALVSFLVIFAIVIPIIQNLKANSYGGNLLTGRIFDEGIDLDLNGLFDYLQIKVEVNITVAGFYNVAINSLKNATTFPFDYAYVYDSISTYLDIGVQNVTMSFYGPTIQISGKSNLRFVDYVYIYGGYTGESRYDLSLSRAYSYVEFDTSFTDMEAEFNVLPNGMVNMTGMLDSAHMPYPVKGVDSSGTINISTNGDLSNVSARDNLRLPSYIASQWPYNSSEVSIISTYSKQVGALNFDLNVTSKLPAQVPYGYSPYPDSYAWSLLTSSDLSVSLMCSNELLNGEINASAVLPPEIPLMFPFNVTDFSVEADYLGGVLMGSITFHIIPGFAASDLTLNFQANRTTLTATGDLTVIFGEFPAYPNPIEVNQTMVDELIANFTVLEGQGAESLFNMTGGLIELDFASEITQTPIVDPNGTTILFDLIFRGDLIGTVAYIMSNTARYTQDSLTYSGIYRLVNATFSSVNSASLQFSYAHLSKSVSLKLLFEANQETFLTDLFTFDPDKTACAVLSYSMYPTLQIGDLIIVQECTDPSTIYAAPPPQGDIVAFWHLNPWGGPSIWIHRAVGKVTADGKTYLITQGDANYGIDTHYNMTSGYPVPEVLPGLPIEYVIGKAVERIPYVGQLFSTAGFSAQTLSEDYPTLIRDFLNEVQTLTLKLTHQGTDRIIAARLSFVFDIEGFQEKIIPKLPDLVPETYYGIVTKLVNNIYANVTSADISFSYKDGQANFLASFTVRGNFTEETNLLKNIYIDETTKYMPPSYQFPWLTINQTWVDACNIKAYYDVEESRASFYLEGLKALPPIDRMNATTFRLYEFFNITAPTFPYQSESPRSGERLKLTVQGCNNGTHIVTLFRPTYMPAPDSVSEDGTLMIWNNQSISILKDLIFRIQYYCDIPWDGQMYSIITHSNGTASSVTFDQPLKKLYLTIDGPSGAVGFANVSIPSVLLDAQPESWRIVVGNRTIVYPEYQITETATHTFLYFTFTFGSPISIQIIGTEAIPEFPSFLLLSLFMIATLLAAMVVRRRHTPPF